RDPRLPKHCPRHHALQSHQFLPSLPRQTTQGNTRDKHKKIHLHMYKLIDIQGTSANLPFASPPLGFKSSIALIRMKGPANASDINASPPIPSRFMSHPSLTLKS